MTKDVLLSISGLHYEEKERTPVEAREDSPAPLEVISKANYYYKNGKHYVVYDELVEGMAGVIKNRIQYEEGQKLEIFKNGISNTHMVFENGKMNVTEYQTPYGEFMVAIHTKSLRSVITESEIRIEVTYELDINREKVSDCEITIRIKALEK